ncbi:MAG TPA: DUF2510 domain-containing protein [Geodermatophilus sp.]|nr:DUF2510 domain-containing protein [Geodermatophilus sp.]
MTGPGQPSAPPGWYPDPDGAPGTVRWWNGVSWSDVTTPAGPGVIVHSPPAPPPTPTPAPQPPPPPQAPWTRRTAWVVGLTALGLVLVVVVALLVGRTGVGGRVEELPPADPPVAGPTFPEGTVRIIDEAAGISYPYLGNGWYEYDLGPMVETTAVAGQYFTTQDQTPDGIFIAQCTSGPLAEGYGWAGPGTLQTTATTVADSVRAIYYPAPNERRILRDETLTIDGAAAYLIEFDLSWDVEGYDATGERAALLLIDVGRPAPALLYISIPNTHAELYGHIDRVLGDIDVL